MSKPGPRSAWICAAIFAAALASCVREPDPPPVPRDLEARSAELQEVSRLVTEIEGADTKTAVGFLAHADHRVRRAAALRLGALADKAFNETSSLVAALEDPHPRVRTAAARALADIGDPSVVPALALKITDQEPAVRRWVWKALLRFGEPAVDVLVPKMAKEIESGEAHYVDEAGREHHTRAILREHLPLFGKAAVPGLMKALDSDDEWLRTNSANVLGQIGKDAAAAVPRLITLLRTDPDKDARFRAAQALGRIETGNPDLRPALEAAAKDKEKKVAQEARRSLKALDKSEKERKKQAADQAKKKADREKKTAAAKAKANKGGVAGAPGKPAPERGTDPLPQDEEGEEPSDNI